ncbi:MAG: hypothetical protein ACE5FP_10130, partial [Gemmatimonadota bacterium]
LDDYSGVAICDGYKAYDTLAREREGSDLTLAHCRVGGDVAAPAPHRSGRAGFPHPVLHGSDSLATVY